MTFVADIAYPTARLPVAEEVFITPPTGSPLKPSTTLPNIPIDAVAPLLTVLPLSWMPIGTVPEPISPAEKAPFTKGLRVKAVDAGLPAQPNKKNASLSSSYDPCPFIICESISVELTDC